MPALTLARQRLWEMAFAFADDWKEKAFATVFMEPTKMYYMACGEEELAENVEVHGSSVYLAILLSTLAIWCPRLPFLLDSPIAAVSFLDALDNDQVQALWREEHLGKGYASVPECREPRAHRSVGNHWSNFLFNGRQPWQVANNAVDPCGPPEQREKLKPYIEQFAWYFSVEVIVPRLSQHLLSRDEGCEALQVVFDSLRADRGVAIDEEEIEDVRHWLWDLEAFPARLHLDRATLLLERSGILRCGTAAELPLGGPPSGRPAERS